MRCGSILNVGFQKVLLLQNNLNLSVSEIISTYTYNIGLNSSGAVPQYSYGACHGLFYVRGESGATRHRERDHQAPGAAMDCG